MKADVKTTKRPDRYDLALGEAVRTRRRLLRFSQHDLGARCGVSFQQIQKYENGGNRISFSRLLQIAKALGCPAAELFAGFDSADPAAPDLKISARLQTPGAMDLLAAYEGMKADERSLFLTFLNSASS